MPRKKANLPTFTPDRPLDNPKWEAFARAMGLGNTQAVSAQIAGYKEKNLAVQGCRLLKRPEIATRVTFLKTKDANKAILSSAVSKSWVLQNLREISNLSIQAEDYSSANRANELIGKELGMFVDRKVVTVEETLRAGSAEDLFSILAQLDRQLGKPAQQTLLAAAEVVPDTPAGESQQSPETTVETVGSSKPQ